MTGYVDSAVTSLAQTVAPFSSLRIDKYAATPIYQQIAEAIGSLLAIKVLPPRHVLPPTGNVGMHGVKIIRGLREEELR